MSLPRTAFVFAIRAVACSFLLSAAPPIAAQPAQDSGAGRRVSIDPDVPQPEIPLIQSPGNFKAFLIGGGIGAAVDQTQAGRLFRDYMRKNNIDVSKIVLDSFRRTITEDRILALADGSDTRLKLVINTYGFGASGFFGGDERRPMMNVTASLVAGGGNVLWKKTGFITNLSKETTAYTYDQLGRDPQLTAKSLEQVSSLLSHQLLSDLKQ
ncbi:MAG TPA: hypothetical protein VF110_01995 [Burkholderiales bacterium]